MRRASLLILFIFGFTACDKGLSPDLAQETVGFGGTVTITGDWNSDISETRIVLFKEPLLSVTDFSIFNLRYVSDTIPNGSQVYNYSTEENSSLSNIEAGEYAYLAVAQSKKDTITLNREDWFVVGVYYTQENTTQPGKLLIPEATFVDGINIYCDLNNPPPQPPGGNPNFQILNQLLKYDYNHEPDDK